MHEYNPKSLVFKAFSAAAATVALIGAPAANAADVGVSISISQPGVHGRIDIGRYPQPVLVVPQPVVVMPAPRPVRVQPVYLWVPDREQRNWSRYCSRYGACGVPVYFVRDDWYQRNVMVERRGPPGHAYGHDRKGPPHQGGPGRHGRDRDDDRGRGNGNGHGHGRGHD